MVQQGLVLSTARAFQQPVDIIHDLLGDAVGHALAGFDRVMVPDVIEPRGGVLGSLSSSLFLRAARRARTCVVLSTRPAARSSSAFKAREMSLAFSRAFSNRG